MDHELASAIDSLQSSTEAIEKQCRVLEAQRDALMALKALDKPNMTVEHMRNERRRDEHQEKSRLDIAVRKSVDKFFYTACLHNFQVEDVSTSISEQLADTQREIETEKSELKTYLTERLASDDKILTALPGIVSKIATEPEISEDEKFIDQWCNAIISFRTAEIKARVDAIYLNSLTNRSPDNLPDASEDELRSRKAELQAEMETLHSEIASVAEMVVEHELRKPMNDIKERKERERVQARGAWLKYVLSTLDFMSKRLDTVTAHTSNVHEFQQVLERINSAAQQRISDLNTESLTPSRRRTTSSLKSAFPPVKLRPTKSLDLPKAVQDALRYAGISFNQNNIEALSESLLKTQLEREKKLGEHYASAASSTQDTLAERFGKADGDLKPIVDALYSHTPFSTINLLDSEREDQLKEMERKLQNADHDLLNAEASELSLSDPRVRAFVSKYGK